MKNKLISIGIGCLLIVVCFFGYHNLETENTASAEWLPEIELSTDSGTEYQSRPSIAVENGMVYVVWDDYDGGDSDIYYRYFDGISWSPEQIISTDIGTENQVSPRIAVDNGKLHVVWRNDYDGDWDIYYRYFDGTSWQDEEEISTDIGTENQIETAIAAENGRVYVVWEYNISTIVPNSVGDIYYRCYNGTDWEPEQEISTDIIAEYQGSPSIAVENGKVHVVWADMGDGDLDIYYRNFNGTDWQVEQKISTDEETECERCPSIAVENDKLHVVWFESEDMSSKHDNISYRYYDGVSWHPDELICEGKNESEYPVIAVENGKLYVAWSDRSTLGYYDIYFRHFNGITWEPSEMLAGIPYMAQLFPSIAVENGMVHIVWQDNRDGDMDIYYRRFVPPDLEVTVDDIVFDPISPVFSGTAVTINATIHNIGAGNGSNIAVRFYDGDPGDPIGTGPGVQIDVDQIIPSIPAGENRSVQVTWTANLPGIHKIYVVVDPLDIIAESNETNNIASKDIEVIGISPPTLYIAAVGNDIVLNWTQSKTTGVSHYLLYNSTSQTDFNFSDVWVNTSQYDDNGIIPLRTTLNDTGAASAIALQKYYTLRTVFESGDISFTSRTVGKWTKTFPEGVSSFSLPLEPLENITIDNCLNDMNATYIKWMNQTTHTWMKHEDGGVNDTQMKMGEGYEVKFSNQTNYTFTGMPGAMISYDDETGFSGFNHTNEAKNLTVTVEPNGNVTLIWEEPVSRSVGDRYEVYYSNTRDGFFGTFDVDYFLVSTVNFGNNTVTHVGANASNAGARLYYMVVPFNASGVRGASTYSIGIWTEEYISEYDTFGIPLKLSNYKTADWYCDNIPDTVGMNYYIVNEQRWGWHSERMPAGAYDPILKMIEGYQISTSSATKFIFIGV